MKTDSLLPAFTGMILFCLLFSVSFAKAEGGSISVNFRFDDAGSEAAPARMEMLIDLFSEFGVPCTFGVIPFHRDELDTAKLIPLTAEVVGILKEPADSGIVEIALHGYLHESHSHPRNSEFAGIPYEDQFKWVTDGKRALDDAFGAEVEVFIPPYNSYDENTVRALRDSGIDIVSASAEHIPLDDCPRYLVPLCCKTHRLKEVVQAAQASKDQSAVIVAYFHISRITADNNRLPYISQEYLREVLTWLKMQEGVEIRSLREIAQYHDLGKNRYVANFQLRRTNVLILPIFAASRYPYFSAETAKIYSLILAFKLAAVSLAAVVFISTVIFFINKLFLSRIIGSVVLRISILMLPVFVSSLCCVFTVFSWRTMVIGYLVLGVLIGTLGEMRFTTETLRHRGKQKANGK